MAVAAGIVKSTIAVVTTVHAVQVLDEGLPSTHHDVPIDYVATPAELICCYGDTPHPTGIYWEDLDETEIAQIPVLQRMQNALRRS